MSVIANETIDLVITNWGWNEGEDYVIQVDDESEVQGATGSFRRRRHSALALIFVSTGVAQRSWRRGFAFVLPSQTSFGTVGTSSAGNRRLIGIVDYGFSRLFTNLNNYQSARKADIIAEQAA